MKVFFSYGSEDKAAVERVYQRVAEAFPDIEAWLDKYEIVGGNDLIDKIAEGIDSADKFLIFLSEASIDKPWVKAELHKALMAEIAGVKPDFIVPVKLGAISKFPSFIEAKRYIDLAEQTEDQWLREIEAAIRGVPHRATAAVEDNLEVWVEPAPGEANAVAVVLRPRYWAEAAAFFVQTHAPIIERRFEFAPPVMALMGVMEMDRQDGSGFAVSIQQPLLPAGHQLRFIMKFPPGTDLNRAIAGVGRFNPNAPPP